MLGLIIRRLSCQDERARVPSQYYCRVFLSRPILLPRKFRFLVGLPIFFYFIYGLNLKLRCKRWENTTFENKNMSKDKCLKKIGRFTGKKCFSNLKIEIKEVRRFKIHNITIKLISSSKKSS